MSAESSNEKVKKEVITESKGQEKAGNNEKDGVKWTSLKHNGPLFAPAYEPLPEEVHFEYDGKVMRLEPEAEEVMTLYARMLDNDYTTKKTFNKNFFEDWREKKNSEQIFEKARELKSNIANIRSNYEKDLTDDELEVKQRAVIIYLLDELALRVGKEKKVSSAVGIGCCTLRCEHIKFHEDFIVEFDFLGKHSVRYHNKVSVPKQVYENLKLFSIDKKESDELFDMWKSSEIEYDLKTESGMKGLTPKVFRTYKACIEFQKELNLTNQEDDKETKISFFQSALKKIATLLNHKRAKGRTENQNETEISTSSTTDAMDDLTELFQKQMELNSKSSKLYYADHRIGVAWCKKHKIPLKRLYDGKDYAWALSTDENFEF